jgi:hypothetical protein
MTAGSGWIGYPSKKRHNELMDRLDGTHFHGQDCTAIMDEIRAAYNLYYPHYRLVATGQLPAPSTAQITCNKLIGQARGMLEPLKMMDLTIKPHYDYWIRDHQLAGELRTALEHHIQALDFAWEKIEIDRESEEKEKEKEKPRKQLEARARHDFYRTLGRIYEQRHPRDKTVKFKLKRRSFINDVLDAFGVKKIKSIDDHLD